MASYLDKQGLQTFLDCLREEELSPIQNDVSNLSQRVENLENNGGGGGGSADLTNYYTKEQTDANIEEVASVTARAVNEIKKSIGASNELKVSFDDTTHLTECTSVTSALRKLDSKVVNAYSKEETYSKADVDNMLANVKFDAALFTIGIVNTSDESYSLSFYGKASGGGGDSYLDGNTLYLGGELNGNTLTIAGELQGNTLIL